MDFDDETDSKIRRNLIVLSTVVILLTWLELPIPTITEKVLSSKISIQLNPARVWSATLAVLLYLALRYRFSGEWERFSESYLREIGEKRDTYIEQMLARRLKSFHLGKSEDAIFFGALAAAADEANTNMLRGSDKSSLNRPLGHLNGLRPADTPWTGAFGVSYTWPLDDPRMAATGGTLPYKVEGRDKWKITARSCVITTIYSQSSVRYLVPCILAAAAFITAAINWIHAL